jgi:hypothetical protein
MHENTHELLRKNKEHGFFQDIEITPDLINTLYQKYVDIIKYGDMNIVWVKLKDIKPVIGNRSWTFLGDNFLDEWSKKRELLGLDILENGTYWHFNLNVVEDGAYKYSVKEGVHRLESLFILLKKGTITEDFEILCIVNNEHITDSITSAMNEIPSPYITNDDYKLIFGESQFEINKSSILSADGLTIKKYIMSWFATMMWSLLLRNDIHHFNNIGDRIIASPYINDKEYFIKFNKEVK